MVKASKCLFSDGQKLQVSRSMRLMFINSSISVIYYVLPWQKLDVWLCVCVCARVLPHLAVGKTLQWELKGPAARSHARTLTQLLLQASWGQQQCFPALAAVSKREDQTWRGIARTWRRSLRGGRQKKKRGDAGELDATDTGMKGGRVWQKRWWAKQKFWGVLESVFEMDGLFIWSQWEHLWLEQDTQTSWE